MNNQLYPSYPLPPITEGKRDKYGSILQEKVQQIWKKNFWLAASENIHTVTQRYETLIPFCNPKMLAGPFRHVVVLHGPVGVRKTTLANKCLPDWTQDNLARPRPAAFSPGCRALSRRGTRSLKELLAQSAPAPQRALLQVLAQAQELPLVFDLSRSRVCPRGWGRWCATCAATGGRRDPRLSSWGAC